MRLYKISIKWTEQESLHKYVFYLEHFETAALLHKTYKCDIQKNDICFFIKK